jgi:hypothetical protein
MTIIQKKYLEWIQYNDYEIQEVENEIKNGEKPFVFESNQFYAFENGYKEGLKAKVNFTTVSDYPFKDDYAKTIIQDLLNNSDEYARERAINFLKGELTK